MSPIHLYCRRRRGGGGIKTGEEREGTWGEVEERGGGGGEREGEKEGDRYEELMVH